VSRRQRLRRIWRIARWESTQSRVSFDRRTLLVGLFLVLIVGSIGLTAVALGVASPAPNTDIYRVGIDADSPYAPVVEQHSALTMRPADPAALDDGEIELLVRSGQQSGTVTLEAGAETELTPVASLSVTPVQSDKGSAALTTFRAAVERYNDRLMPLETNETAAYPVQVELQYRSQSSLSPDGLPTADPADVDDDDTAGDGRDDDTADGGGSTGAADDTVGDDRDDTATSDRDDSVADRDDPELADDRSLLGGLFGEPTSGSPADIQPPFPFSSLLLAFLFLVPMNFVIQAYGSTVLNERIGRRGELLLVAPVHRLDIVAGKTLPYLAAAVTVTVAIALAIGGGVVSILAVIPVAFTFLAATFVGAMFARSFKELTFVTVTISVFLTTYVFVPAIFTNVTPIALISPLTLVVMDLQGDAIGIGAYTFSTAPFYLSAGVLFLLGTGVYREEDMFTQKAVPLKFLDALDARLSGIWSVGLLSALFIPFVFIAELLAIAVLFVLPIELSVPLLLVVIAAIEEVAKSIHIYAGFESDRFARSGRLALVLGAVSGVGFFLAEKFTAVAQVVGLPELAIGQAAFTPAGITPSTTLALLAAPLVLHVVTAGISALGAQRNVRWYLVALAVATVVHAGYNFGVVSIYG